jgi:hypothetical protein
MSTSVHERPAVSEWIETAWRQVKDNRHILVPAVVCNPTLVLHALNVLSSCILPPEPSPALNTWIQPHLDVHANTGSCKIFVLLMVALQLRIYVPNAMQDA